VTTQLDRIERKVGQIAEGKIEIPPPVPSKDESPPSSPSSISSASTARAVTPPNDAVAQQLDDMRRLLGTVIGQNNDILNETARRRSFEVQLSPRGPGLRRIEDLLRRALLHLGDSEIAAELGRESGDPQSGEAYHASRSPTEEGLTREGSIYPGSDAMYSDEYNPKVNAPANSFTEDYAQRRRGHFSGVPQSLLEGDLPEPDLDEQFAMRDLPPQTPPAEYMIPRSQVPPHMAQMPRQPPQQTPATEAYEYPQEEYTDYGSEQGESQEQDQAPVPYGQDQQSDRSRSEYGDEVTQRSATRLPPPQPVDLPTPVRTPQSYPAQMGPSYGGMPPPPPGMGEMLRPSLPRIAGVRDPISTT